MPKPDQYLLIGSTEAYSGKSAAILGIAHQLQEKGIDIAYGKPLGTCWSNAQTDGLDEDVRLMAEVLQLSPQQIRPTLLSLDPQTLEKRLLGEDSTNYQQLLTQYPSGSGGKFVLLEGPGSLAEGRLFDLSVRQMSDAIAAQILLVTRFQPEGLADTLLAAREHLGERLLGAMINDVPPEKLDWANHSLKPFLERQGIPILGILPVNNLLRSVSVRDLVEELDADILCRADRQDLMVENLTIGAMNVNSALKYFRKGTNMAVVTGGDRTDIQLAALETSTQCLILTGHLPPPPFILSRAEDLEIPVLSVDLDTLTTVEIIDRAFGQVRLHEPIKIECIRQLMSRHFDIDRLMGIMGLEPAITA